MKLESEPGFTVQTPPRKSYNPFDSDEDDTDGFVRSNVHVFDIKSFEKNDDSLTFHLDNSGLSWEEALLSQPPILNHTMSTDAKSENGVFRKDTELFTDKTVTECEVPELMVCYKENGYHSVKDIGIDEGVPKHEKVWVKSRDNEESEDISTFLALKGNTNVALALTNEHQGLPSIEGLKSRPDDNFEKDAPVKGSGQDDKDFERLRSAKQCGTDDSVKLDELKCDLIKKDSDFSLQTAGDKTKTGGVVREITDHKLSKTDKLNHVDKKGNEVSEAQRNTDEVPLEYVEESSLKPSVLQSTEAIIAPSKIPTEVASSPQSSEIEEESAGSGTTGNALRYSSKLESGSIILDFNSSNKGKEKEEEKERDKVQHNVALEKIPEAQILPNEKPPRMQTMSRHDDGSPGMDKWVHGETSFSAEAPPPASITFMGPNARSGSISLRSESSAGSTRSFAFPVLQAEWNSSPVRMAKAEQRNFQKHRGWVHSLMCCRF